MCRILEYTLDESSEGKMLRTFLRSGCRMSAAVVSDLKKFDDGICVNGKRENVLYILKKGDRLRLCIHETVQNELTGADIPFEVLYEDEDIMAVNKPPFLPVHPAAGNYHRTLANAVTGYWLSRGEQRAFRAVNRLDKNTSGVMLIAKNAYAHSRLCDMLHTNDMSRVYTAIVEGNIDSDGVIDAPIAREGAIRRCVREDGQPAVTNYRVLQRLCGYTLLEVRLLTGRTHQIRVHMSHIGHPVVCDFLYGSEDYDDIHRQALHSARAEFIQPVTGKRICIDCPIFEDMQMFIDKYSL